MEFIFIQTKMKIFFIFFLSCTYLLKGLEILDSIWAISLSELWEYIYILWLFGRSQFKIDWNFRDLIWIP